MEFWNGGDPDTRGHDHADAWYLREHLVELPIHQDITPEQIDYMARAGAGPSAALLESRSRVPHS